MSPTDQPKPHLPLSVLLDYLDDKLDKATARQVEQQLQEDEKSATIVEGIRSFYEQHGHDREKLKAWLAASEQRIQETIRKHHPPRQKKVLLLKFVPIAASIVILLGVVYFFLLTPAPDAPTLVSTYLDDPYPAPELFRDNGSSNQQWIIAYRDGKYESASDSLQARMDAGQSGAEIKFYAGLCLLYSDFPDYEQAASFLKEVVNTGNIYQQSARWHLALSNYQAGKMKATKELLHTILQTPGHVKQAEAEQLLNAL